MNRIKQAIGRGITWIINNLLGIEDVRVNMGRGRSLEVRTIYTRLMDTTGLVEDRERAFEELVRALSGGDVETVWVERFDSEKWDRDDEDGKYRVILEVGAYEIVKPKNEVAVKKAGNQIGNCLGKWHRGYLNYTLNNLYFVRKKSDGTCKVSMRIEWAQATAYNMAWLEIRGRANSAVKTKYEEIIKTFFERKGHLDLWERLKGGILENGSRQQDVGGFLRELRGQWVGIGEQQRLARERGLALTNDISREIEATQRLLRDGLNIAPFGPTYLPLEDMEMTIFTAANRTEVTIEMVHLANRDMMEARILVYQAGSQGVRRLVFRRDRVNGGWQEEFVRACIEFLRLNPRGRLEEAENVNQEANRAFNRLFRR